MPTNTKSKAVLVADKAMIELLKRKVADFRKGLGSYTLYGIDHVRGQVVVLASEPTAADFNKYVTAKAKADVVARYDQVVEYRDAGSYSNPKVTILCWTKAE